MDALPRYMGDETLAVWLVWGQTDEDRAAIAEWHAECAAVAAGHERAREIELTDTRSEAPTPTPTTFTATVSLFPTWEAPAAPMIDALRIAVARAHLEAA